MIAELGQQLPVLDEPLGQPGALGARQVHPNLGLATGRALRLGHPPILGGWPGRGRVGQPPVTKATTT
jgi:hypothetical protein